MRTAARMGLDTVAVFSDADADAPFVREADEAVRLGPAPSRESYLSVEKILDAAVRTGADAIHPGFGFLAENAEFAEAVEAAGLIFVGPGPEAIRAIADLAIRHDILIIADEIYAQLVYAPNEHLSIATLPGMRERKSGLILNVVSLAGLRTLALAGVPYCASKFAQSSIGTLANLEGLPDGVRVTNIYPGETNTPILDKRPQPPPPERRAEMVQTADIAAMAIAVAKLPPRTTVPEIVITPRHMPYV